MNRLTDNNIILVRRKTRLENLIARYNTISQAKFYIEHLGCDFSDYANEDDAYRKAMSEACSQLEGLGRVHILDRDYLPSYIFDRNDTVVAIGQDGLVANTLKYLTDQILIGVNPDPARWDGVLLPFRVSELKFVVLDVFRKKRKIKEVTMAKASLNDGQSLYAVNDLFIGQRTHVSARYHIASGSRQEDQSSSGIIVSTGLGSTGWLKSILTGASNIVNEITDRKINIYNERKFEWNSDCLYYSIREPFASKTSMSDMVFGKITKGCPLNIISQMPENGVIFSDGIENDYLQFNSGIEAVITVAEKKGRLAV